MTTLYGYVSNTGAPEYDDIMQSDLPTDEKVKQIKMRGQAYRDELDREALLNYGRMGLGTAISAASMHPILNIPYIGTGLGGAMYELGQGMVEGDKLPEILKRTGQGFLVGETVGALPYVGKGVNKLSGGRIGEGLGNVASKIAETPTWQKIEDALMTDIIPNTNKKPVYYHGTSANFDEFSPEFIGTAHDEGLYGKGFYFTPSKNLAKSYAKSARNGEMPRVIAANLEMKNPLKMEDFKSAEDIAKYLDMEENVGDFIPTEYSNVTIYRPNGFLQRTGKFKSRIRDLGHDGVIVGDNEAVVFNPEQIQQINQQSLADYLANESVLTKGYRKNKKAIDQALLSGKRKLDMGLNPFSKTTKDILFDELLESGTLDLTGVFDKKPTPKQVREYIQSLVDEGAMETKSPEYLIDVPDTRLHKRHIQYPKGNENMLRKDKNEHNALAMKLKDIINNSKHSKYKANEKPLDKPNVEGYHYFKVNIKVGEDTFPVILDTEQFIGESTAKPQTVHLYNFSKKNK